MVDGRLTLGAQNSVLGRRQPAGADPATKDTI